jgi:DNA-binding CsgD family transcriptional regulator
VSDATDDVLLEREREVATLTAAIDDPVGAGLVLVEGPPGIGKSRLLATAAGIASDAGLLVLSARASELESSFSFGVVRQLLERVIDGLEPHERRSAFAGAAALARPLFEGEIDPNLDHSPVETSFGILHGLFWLLDHLSSVRPVLIVVDDLQWCDSPSLRWLLYLLPRIDSLPILVATSIRSTGPPTTLLLTRIVADPGAEVLRLPPLTEVAASTLVRRAVGPDADDVFCRACFDACRGNPLLLRTLLGAVGAEGLEPTGSAVPALLEIGAQAVARPVALQLAGLSTGATRLSQTAAILGDGIGLSSAAELAGLDAATARRCADELVLATVLETVDPVTFSHPLIRGAIYHDIPAPERASMHDEAARSLASAGARLERVASHLLLAARRGDDPWVIDTLRSAGDAAIRQGAPDVAVTYLRRALEENPPTAVRAEILLELGTAETVLNNDDAVTHLEEAVEHLEGSARTSALPLLGMNLYLGGRYDRLRAVCDEIHTSSPPAPSRVVGILDGLLLAASILDPETASSVDEAQRTPAPLGDDAVDHVVQAYTAYRDGRAGVPAAVVVPEARAALNAPSLFDLPTGALAFLAAVQILIFADDVEAVTVLDRTIATSRPGDTLYLGATLCRALAMSLRGDLIDAEADARNAFERFDTWGIPSGRTYSAAYLADILIERGDLDGAEATLDTVQIDERFAHNAHVLWMATSRARVSAERGRLHEALAGLRAAGERYAALGGANPAFLPWRSLAAEVSLRIGDRDTARRLVDEEVALAGRWGAPTALGRSLRVAATVAETDDELDLLAASIDVLEGSPARLELAKSLVASGTALRHRRQASAARDPLRRALEIATACGADPLADRARTELLATGARPRRVALTGVAALTPSEQRVAELAAGGVTNREIAQQLFVTPKTVEVHLSSAYRKLGVSSRLELGGVLATEGQGRQRS